MSIEDKIWPLPRKTVSTSEQFKAPPRISIHGEDVPSLVIDDLRTVCGIEVCCDSDAFRVDLRIERGSVGNKQGYRLSISEQGGTIVGEDQAGLFYGLMTLVQYAAAERAGGQWCGVEITDYPQYENRSFMVDMGRSVFSLDYLKLIVRLLARLKMNQLHLHLYDDELCGIRFEGHDFGHDNPYAISIAELAELVHYAQDNHVEIIPELEAWGHVGSIAYHRPDLRGGEGMFGGSSFKICEDMFGLMRDLIGQVLAVMPKKCRIHLGLDEAKWYPGSDMPEGYTPSDMVGRYHEILQELATQHGRDATLVVWADHAGRPLPEEIEDKVLIQPWMYWRSNVQAIETYVKKYGQGRTPWMAGAGQSAHQFGGSYQATRLWAQKAIEASNCQGINICFWGRNDLWNYFSTLYVGGQFLWNANPEASFGQIESTEDANRILIPRMYAWQNLFSEARPDVMAEKAVPTVFFGHYHWGPEHGQTVSPAAAVANTLTGHDYLNEHKASSEED